MNIKTKALQVLRTERTKRFKAGAAEWWLDWMDDLIVRVEKVWKQPRRTK